MLPEDDRPGAAPVAIISSRVWKSQFEGTAKGIGYPVNLSGKPTLVRGVAPEGFNGPLLGQSIDVWLNLGALQTLGSSPDLPDHVAPVRLLGRLRQGAARDDAERQSGATLRTEMHMRTLAETRYDIRSEASAEDDRTRS